ncbi:MAG: hypothetical protein CMM45_10335 [Rhodospirillaceae bacterium]|nr:hypothetical protein [Rhodospirillaceae bacterium]
MTFPGTAFWREFCGAWVHGATRHARAVMFGLMLITLLSGYYALANLSVNTDTEDMLSPDLPFRQHSKTLSMAFPQFSDNIVVVVDAPTPDQTYDAANLLLAQLQKNTALFGTVFDPATHPFFQKNGLLYLSIDDLEAMAERLSNAQPFIGRLNQSPTLPEFFRLLNQIITADTPENNLISQSGITALFRDISRAVEGQTTGSREILPWRGLVSGEAGPASANRRIIVLQPKTDFASLSPGAEAIDEIRRLAQTLQLKERFAAGVRITGSLALAQEELESVVEGLGLAAVLSLVLVACLLFWGLKSICLLLATVLTLLCGLLLTAGFATLAVGTLNLISLAFAVLFIGLSVDFGIHLCLRYQEQAGSESTREEALVQAAKRSCGALTLTAVAAAIGFYSFLPTDYRGLAELGLIAGSGMFIALFVNLTLLPALIVLMPNSADRRTDRKARSGIPLGAPVRRRGAVIIGFLVITGICITTLTRASFDFDPINLRNPDTESVATLFDLMTDVRQSPYAISILAENKVQAEALGGKLEVLSSVKSVTTPSDLVPPDQDKKLDVIEGLSFLISPSLADNSPAHSLKPETIRESFISLSETLTTKSVMQADASREDAIERLSHALSKFQKQTKLMPDAMDGLTSALLGSLPARLTELKLSLEAEAIKIDDIPPGVRDRFIAQDERARVDVYPAGDMSVRSELERFVEDVRAVAPYATGAPVTILEAGNTVVHAFIQAAATSLLLIAGLVILFTGCMRDIVLIILPLAVAAVMTSGASGLLELPFNFANVIVLPLLFGLGIAGNIHLVIRERQTSSADALIASSTPRAVLFSALTTVGSFGSISLSSHPGTASMGILLTIAIVSSLLCSLILLPSLMGIWPAGEPREVAT